MDEIKVIAEKATKLSEIKKHRSKLISSLKEIEGKLKKGILSIEDYALHVAAQHLGLTKKDWLKECDDFLKKAEYNIRLNLNSMIQKRFSV